MAWFFAKSIDRNVEHYPSNQIFFEACMGMDWSRSWKFLVMISLWVFAPVCGVEVKKDASLEGLYYAQRGIELPSLEKFEDGDGYLVLKEDGFSSEKHRLMYRASKRRLTYIYSVRENGEVISRSRMFWLDKKSEEFSQDHLKNVASIFTSQKVRNYKPDQDRASGDDLSALFLLLKHDGKFYQISVSPILNSKIINELKAKILSFDP